MLPGLTQWFTFEDRKTVEKTVGFLRELKVTEFRVLFSWADWERPGGQEWFDFFVSKLATVPNLKLLPVLFYTPADRAMVDAKGQTKTSYPPKNPQDYADFVGEIIKRYGRHFDWLQIWNEPNWKPYWDSALDPDWDILMDMCVETAAVIHKAGKRAVLGGVTPLELPWLAHMACKGLLAKMDAVAFHFSPSWPNQHRRWFPLESEVASLKALLIGFNLKCEAWLGESGFSTYESTEEEQVRFFDYVRKTKTDRTYWFCLFDQQQDAPTDDMLNTGLPPDYTAYHFGIIKADGAPKKLFSHWKNLAQEKSSDKTRSSRGEKEIVS